MEPDSDMEAVKGAKVLMVGAGGIGCELLKTLALSGFEDIHIIDMDTIEVSNLNRQFLFRQCHVGQSKAKVARDAVLKFKPHINITPYHANVKNPEFNVEFFKQFSVALNGLDNLDARRHVNRLCLAAEVPLIESGTTGFLGQVTVHVKGKTECYECQGKPTPKTYPVCTITNTPSKFVHCVVWAKDLLFAKLFGDRSQDNDLNVRSSDSVDASKNTEDVFERNPDEDPENYGQRIYDHVFGYNIELALSNDETWRHRKKPRPIYMKDVLPEKSFQKNGYFENSIDVNMAISAMPALGLKSTQDIWSLAENTKVFLEALSLFIKKRDIGNLTFDKDDQLAVEFVTAAANIRASSFGIPMHSLFETKGIAGNIVHAVATTNAIIAGLIVIEAIKVLQGDFNNYRMTYCLECPTKKMLLMPIEPFEANESCYVCQQGIKMKAAVEDGKEIELIRKKSLQEVKMVNEEQVGDLKNDLKEEEVKEEIEDEDGDADEALEGDDVDEEEEEEEEEDSDVEEVPAPRVSSAPVYTVDDDDEEEEEEEEEDGGDGDDGDGDGDDDDDEEDDGGDDDDGQEEDDEEEMGTDYLVRPIARPEDEEDASDFEPGEENGEDDDIDEEDDDGETGKEGPSAKRKRSPKDDDDDDDDDDGDDDDERPSKR